MIITKKDKFKTIKDYLPTPIHALKAMQKGLTKYMEKEGFEIDMESYGSFAITDGKPICFGCAATCTIQEAVGKSFNDDNISSCLFRSYFLKIETSDLFLFEMAINAFREGSYDQIFEYYGLHHMYYDFINHNITDSRLLMINENLHEAMDHLERIIEELEELYNNYLKL